MWRNHVRFCTLATLVLSFSVALPAASQTSNPAPSDANVVPGAERPSSPERVLRAAIKAGHLDDLRWPDFSDYREDVQEFYSQSRFTPGWLRNGQPTPQALQMINLLQEADEEGLHPEDYDSGRWIARLVRLQSQHSPADEARFDLALTVCAIRYSSDVHVGRINPQYFKFALRSGPDELDLPGFVRERLANGTDLSREVMTIEPPFAGYHQLREALLKYMQFAKQDDGSKLPPSTGPGYPGPPYPGYLRLARLLRLLGDLPPDYSIAAASSKMYDPALLDGVRHFQERHGLAATGYLDAETVGQLNVPLTSRVEQIRLALERYRWLHADFRQPPIVVNLPGFHLYTFNKEGEVALKMKVDVGDDYESTRTPVMEDNIEYIVFRPYWDVPLGIQKDEIVPAILEDPAYLSKYHFEVIAPGGRVITTGMVTKNVLNALRTGRLRVRQRPGPENALGLVKFIFPNHYNVYLHDIPAREFYFGLGKRVVSHGCVHVEQPAELAAWILRNQPGWNLERVQQAMRAGHDNFRVNLSQPLPVLFVYTTAFARADGDMDFYRDIYGYDAELSQALAAGYPQSRQHRSATKKVTGSHSGSR